MLNGLVAVVTGAGSGIGAAIARAFVAHGASVVLDDVTESGGAKDLFAEVRAGEGDAILVEADVSRPDHVDRLFGMAIDHYGRVDVLVNNAGVSLVKSIVECTPDEWDGLLATNLKGQFLCAQAATAVMMPRHSGRIINVTSGVVELALANMSAHCASKYGIVGLTRSLALELAPHGILVNAIAPGAVDTPLNRDTYTPRVRERYHERIPLGRIGTADDIARVAVFLASPLADYVCGQTIVVDGGLNINGSVGHGED